MPQQCMLCLLTCPPPKPLCEYCAPALPWLQRACRMCALPLPPAVETGDVCSSCLGKPPPQQASCAPFHFAPPVSQWIHALKFHNDFRAGDLLGRLMADHIEDIRPPAAIDALIPMPLSLRRLFLRGHNQSAALAKCVGAALGIPVRHRALTRAHRPPQRGHSRASRLKNVAGIFTGCPGEVQGKHIALIDDVMTTGATAVAASRALLKAGAGSVEVWVAARATLT